MVWVKAITDRNDYSTVFALGTTDPTVCTVQTDADGTTLTVYAIGTQRLASASLVVGTWAHICITRSAGGAYTLYKDGASILTFTEGTALVGTCVEFGADSQIGFTEWVDGEFRGGRAWTVELTSGEVAAEKASATVVKTANLFADWDMATAAAAGTDRNGSAAPLTAANLSDGASDPSIYGAATAAVSSRRKKQTIHPGKHPDRFGRHLRTKRNSTVTAATITGSASITNADDTLSASGFLTPLPQSSRRQKTPNHPGKGPYNFLKFKKSKRNTAAPLAGVSGSAAILDADDTVSATGTTTVIGSAAKTNSDDTASAAGTTSVIGVVAKTEGRDTASASGSPNDVGASSATESHDSISASGTTTIVGAGASTEARDTAAASGSPVLVGVLAKTNGDDTAVASGTAGSIVGAANCIEQVDTCAAAGIVTTPTPPETNRSGTLGDPSPRREHWPKRGIGYQEEYRLQQEAEQARAAQEAADILAAAKVQATPKKVGKAVPVADAAAVQLAIDSAVARTLEDQEIQRAIAELLQEDEDAMALLMSVL